jgi:hypothetical protein
VSGGPSKCQRAVLPPWGRGLPCLTSPLLPDRGRRQLSTRCRRPLAGGMTLPRQHDSHIDKHEGAILGEHKRVTLGER